MFMNEYQQGSVLVYLYAFNRQLVSRAMVRLDYDQTDDSSSTGYII